MIIFCLMEGWQIAVLVVCIVVGLYLILATMGIIFVVAFTRIFKKHNTALGLMIHSKYDNIKKLIDVLNKNGVTVPFKDIEMINAIKPEYFYNQDDPNCILARNNLSAVRNDLNYIISSKEELNKNMELRRSLDAINEQDAQYRTLIAMYNADVLGYNYWISFILIRYLKKIFKLKNKQII